MADEADRVTVAGETRDAHARVRAEGEFDLATARFLDEALRTLADGGATRFTIDLRDVPFMDSAGLHPMVQLMRRRPAVTITVVNAQPGVANLFRLHGVESLIDEVVA